MRTAHHHDHPHRAFSTAPGVLVWWFTALVAWWPTVLVAQPASGPVTLDPAASNATQGFLYGRVTTSTSTYQGFLRWGGEEAFWGDHFNGTQDTSRWTDLATGSHRTRREPLKLFGITIGLRWDARNVQHLAALRFGDIARLDMNGRDVTVHLKGGERLELDGGSNDIGADVQVADVSLGTVDLDWRRITRVEFLAVPDHVRDHPVPSRLYGTMVSEAGTFTGFIQWDLDECLSTDLLDGDSRDDTHEIPMGTLRSIERRSRSSARVVLDDGRTLVLDGTNDVDHRNDGIFVETPDRGRVLVSWDSFDRLDFAPAPNAGPAYDDFAPTRHLRGRVTLRDGTRHRGRLVYDLDESLTAEILNGNAEGAEYHIPFGLVRRVEPQDDRSRVTLEGGITLTLDDAVDVDDGNGGLLVFTEGVEKPLFVPWADVAQVDFD